MTAPAKKRGAVHVGLNLNNREALIAPEYGARDLLELGERAEGAGFDSLWVGDSLVARPRYEPLVLLAALAERTRSVTLGTACLVTTLRNPVQLAQVWATLDVVSNGRTVLGACPGNVVEDAVKEEFAIVGLDHRRRMRVFEEGLRIVRSLLTDGRVTHRGTEFDLDDVGFTTGTEPRPLLPVQTPPPIWVVANPSIGAPEPKRAARAAARVAELGDGWLTCCRASRPEEVATFLRMLGELRSLDGFDVAYQVTIGLADTKADALAEQRRYIDAYYPGFSDAVGLDDWGPTGAPDDVIRWFRDFSDAGVSSFICRFAALDQPGQVERFAAEVLPAVQRDEAAGSRAPAVGTAATTRREEAR
ncbi:MAG: LLM class flavin-dependent oxidoreductase [Actinomycetota bacterium]|nr:LLM class flavin-dependent oxidoreductase [Actinomycetota bacterium]